VSEEVNLDKLMSDIFGVQQPDVKEEKFYISYDTVNLITGFGKFKGKADGNYILVDRLVFDELTENPTNNYIVDPDNSTIIDISGSQVQKNSRLSEVKEWSDNSIAQLTFIKNTRQIFIKIRSQLPQTKTVWIVPRGNYMIPLLTLDLQEIQEEYYNVPKFSDSNSCQILSQVDIDSFTSYREVVNEKDL